MQEREIIAGAKSWGEAGHRWNRSSLQHEQSQEKGRHRDGWHLRWGEDEVALL